MTYKMTPERAKALTEMIGEEYSEGLVGLPFEHECKTYSNRTFVTDEDMMKVFRCLTSKRLFIKFMTSEIVCKALKQEDEYWNLRGDKHVIEWLIDDSERFNVLVAMALEEGVI